MGIGKGRQTIYPTTRVRTLVSQSFRCRYCGRKVKPVGKLPCEVDHIRPVVGGGRNWQNLACSCLECNRRKGTADWEPSPMSVFQLIASFVLILVYDQVYVYQHILDVLGLE